MRHIRFLWILSSLTFFTFTCWAADESVTAPVIDGDSNSTSTATEQTTLSIDQRVAVLERQTNAQINLLNQVNSLQQQLQDMQGKFEELSHTLQTLQSQSASQYADIDSRLNAIVKTESALKNAAISQDNQQKTPLKTQDAQQAIQDTQDTKKNNPPASDLAEKQTQEEQAYQVAYHKVKQENYTQAVLAFKQFITQYPNSHNLPNAYYWLGQVYLLKADGKNAIKQFHWLIKHFPDNPKIKDAQLKLGFGYLLNNQDLLAKKQFQKVIALYPHTATAKLAEARLAQMA